MRGTAVAALIMGLLSGAARAAPCTGDFTATGAVQGCTVDQAGVYEITAYGADSGTGYIALGGAGAALGGLFSLPLGESLSILVGEARQRGANTVACGVSATCRGMRGAG